LYGKYTLVTVRQARKLTYYYSMTRVKGIVGHFMRMINFSKYFIKAYLDPTGASLLAKLPDDVLGTGMPVGCLTGMTGSTAGLSPILDKTSFFPKVQLLIFFYTQ
jgi:hypothetical protein